MSELKEHIFSDIDEVFPRGYCGPLPPQEARHYYLKSEADKVIADLEESHKMEVEQLLMEIVGLKEGAKNLILDNYLKDKEIRHHKHKRCLAMARMCEEAYNRECGLNLEDFTDKEFYKQQIEFWPRWESKWLKIAEKFKEAK